VIPVSTRQPVHSDAEDLPEEYFLDGPVPDGDELLLRTVARVHRMAHRSARLRFAMFATGIVAACAGIVGVGFAVGHHMTTDVIVGGPIQATDRRTGAHMSATMTGTDWTHLTVSMSGLPPGTACRLTVVGRDGSRQDSGGWRTAEAPAPVSLSAEMPPAQVAQIDVSTSNGADLVGDVG
jgi:hypothetical protein